MSYFNPPKNFQIQWRYLNINNYIQGAPYDPIYNPYPLPDNIYTEVVKTSNTNNEFFIIGALAGTTQFTAEVFNPHTKKKEK